MRILASGFLSIAGIPYEKEMFEGEDVSDIWKGSKRSRKGPLFWGAGEPVAMLQGDWKLHKNEDETALYNLSDNPEEDLDVAGEYPEIFTKLKKEMNDWTGTLPNRGE